MTTVLWLLLAQGLIGAFDTIYYHEYRARLGARGRVAYTELRLHSFRDSLYAVIFGTLPWIAWQGALTFALGAILLAEIVITMADFLVEAKTRDLDGGERVTHAVMGIVYGAMLGYLVPEMWGWGSRETGLTAAAVEAPEVLRWTLAVMSAGVFLSGVRDMSATLGFRAGSWPWTLRDTP